MPVCYYSSGSEHKALILRGRGTRPGARVLLQIASVVDASSAQSRADVLAIGLSAVALLTGLQWVSLTPRKPVQARLCKLLRPRHLSGSTQHAKDCS